MSEKIEKKDHLSFSSLLKFERCEYDGYLKFTGRASYASTNAMMAGTLFHKAIELGYNEEDLLEYLSEQEGSSKYFKKNGKDLYADFESAVKAATYFNECGLYPNLALSQDDMYFNPENPEEFWQELEVHGDISKVPFMGYIDFLETLDDYTAIHDWKFIKDYKKVYNEASRTYEEWYEKYIDQQLLYAYIVYDSSDDETIKNKPMKCEIVGITKQAVPAIKQISFEFKDYDELVSSVRWKLLAARVRYAWKILNETTDETINDLKHCGECESCRSHGIVIRQNIEVE